MARTTGGVTLEVDGLMETLKAFQALELDLRREANGELRRAAGACASVLVGRLKAAASSSGVPVAPRVARSIRVKNDRIPSVSIGGARKVGARGGTAGALVWGSEQGPKGAVNHFAVAPSSGYWIAPTVREFGSSEALVAFRRAIVELEQKHGLL